MSEEYGHLSDGFFLGGKEINDLRKSKKEITQYAKEKLKKLMNKEMSVGELIETEKFQEEYQKNINDKKLLNYYNEYYNNECASLSHGMPISMEHLQSIALKSAIYAFTKTYGIKENISTYGLKELADLVQAQGDRTVQKVSDVHRRRDLDAL